MKQVLLVLILMGSFNAKASNYWPHPEKKSTFEDHEQADAVFLITEALARITWSIKASSGAQKQALLEKLAKEEVTKEILGLGPESTISYVQIKIQMALNEWNKYFPTNDYVKFAQRTTKKWSTQELLKGAHRLTRLGYDFAQVPRPKKVLDILNETVYGPSTAYQSEYVRSLRQTMRDVCLKEQSDHDNDPQNPQEYKWVRKIVKYTPRFIQDYLEGYLGHGKSCESLSKDIMEIVNPHHGVIRDSKEAKGQLEGLSTFLVSKLFPSKSHPTEGALLRRLLKLQKITQLDSWFSEEAAVRMALKEVGEKPNARNFLYLMTLASHNHGMEIYLQKAALEMIQDEQKASQIALEGFKALNHFYGLLYEHRKKRAQLKDGDIWAKSARPYHYWGGALVSCELVNRGYSLWASVKISSILGKVYEKKTAHSSGESIIESSEDVHLHDQGAKDWAFKCL